MRSVSTQAFRNVRIPLSLLAAGIGLALTAAPADAATTKKKEPAAKPAAARQCGPTEDEMALHIRALKEEMMVGALSCNTREGYGTFVRQFEPQLVASGKRMTAVFVRQYGKGGVREVDTFTTKLANEAMKRHMEKGTDVFCADQKKLYDEVLALRGEQLHRYALTRPVTVVTPLQASVPCTTSATATPGAVTPINASVSTAAKQ
jgi:hypothetical protein